MFVMLYVRWCICIRILCSSSVGSNGIQDSVSAVVFVDQCNEASSASYRPVVLKCCVSRKLWCGFFLVEFSFLDSGNVYVLFV